MSAAMLRRPARRLLTGHGSPSPSKCRPLHRAFHASAPRRDLDTILTPLHELVNILHTEVPWYAAIPLSAFIVRGIQALTITQYFRTKMAAFLGLTPLRQVLARQKMEATAAQAMKTGGFSNPKEAQAAIEKEMKAEIAALDKRWGVSLKKHISMTVATGLVQLPIFLAMAETIRQKCGTKPGLLSLTIGPDGYIMGEKSMGETGDAVQGMIGPDGYMIGEQSIDGMDSAIQDTGTAAQDLADAALSTPSKWFDPALATEGALWFPDLLVPDPTGSLSLIVSGLMFANMLNQNRKSSASDSAWVVNTRRVMIGVAVMIAPLTWSLPAAILLYWVGSTASGVFWNQVLNRIQPLPTALFACKRPLYIPPKPVVSAASKKRSKPLLKPKGYAQKGPVR